MPAVLGRANINIHFGHNFPLKTFNQLRQSNVTIVVYLY